MDVWLLNTLWTFTLTPTGILPNTEFCQGYIDTMLSIDNDSDRHSANDIKSFFLYHSKSEIYFFFVASTVAVVWTHR